LDTDAVQNLTHILELSLAVLAVVIALWKRGEWLLRVLVLVPYKNYRAVMKGMAAVSVLTERLDEQDDKLRFIYQELRPNGGASLRDAIDRQSAELVRLRGLSAAVLNSSQIPTFECDPHGRCQFANEAYLRLVGRGREEVLGGNWENCIAQDVREDVMAVWHEAISEGRIFEMRYDYQQPNGHRINALVRADPIPDERGRIVCWLGHVTVQ
jgi:PAS domain S-box-containing protein